MGYFMSKKLIMPCLLGLVIGAITGVLATSYIYKKGVLPAPGEQELNSLQAFYGGLYDSKGVQLNQVESQRVLAEQIAHTLLSVAASYDYMPRDSDRRRSVAMARKIQFSQVLGHVEKTDLRGLAERAVYCLSIQEGSQNKTIQDCLAGTAKHDNLQPDA